MFVCRTTVCDMLALLLQLPTMGKHVALYALSYIFLLRLPSEALPITIINRPLAEEEMQVLVAAHHAVLSFDGDSLTLRLARRKNKPWGGTLRRKCWCELCPVSCPTHVLGPFVRSWPEGTRPFSHITAANALRTLRQLLALLAIADASKYRCHDLRRGHVRDLQMRGKRAEEIKRTGQWKSRRVMVRNYLDDELALDGTVDGTLLSDIVASSDDEHHDSD